MEQLTQAVTDAFKKIALSGAIEQAIEKNLTETINSLVREQLKSYSPFAKLLEAEVAKAMQVDFSRLDLPSYGEMILKIIRAKVDGAANAQLAKTIEEQLVELLATAPAEVSLAELVAEFINEYADRYNGGQRHDRITLIVEPSEYGSRWVHIDSEPEKQKHACSIRFLVTEPEGKVSALRFAGQEIEKTLFVGVHGFERSLFRLHAAGSRLTGLDDDIETYYPGRD